MDLLQDIPPRPTFGWASLPPAGEQIEQEFLGDLAVPVNPAPRFRLGALENPCLDINPRWQRPQLISDEFAVDGPVNYQSLLTSVFSPFIYNAIPAQEVSSCKLSSFMKKFKITSEILSPVEQLWALGFEFVLAGGKLIDYCNNMSFEESSNDYDIWFTDGSSHERFISYIHNNAEKFCVIDKGHVTEFIYAGKKFQSINTIYAGAEHIIQAFDLRVCGVATNGRYVYWVKDALRDVKEKNLVVMNVQANKGSVLRIQKYIKRGYNISGPDFALASLSCLMSFDNDRPDVIDFFTRRKQTISDINEAMGASSQGYMDMTGGFF